MRVKITTTKITRGKEVITDGVGRELFLEGSELEFRALGTVLEIYNPMSKTSYVTDFAFASVDAVLAAAPVTGGHFVLT